MPANNPISLLQKPWFEDILIQAMWQYYGPSTSHSSLTARPTRHPSSERRGREENKYASSLTDQAVRTLCDIWRPHDIPVVFLTSAQATVPGPDDLLPNANSTRPSQNLYRGDTPLPLKPSAPPVFEEQSSSKTHYSPLKSRIGVELRLFVHEVLKRSRTSQHLLQTALCYLEAIRPQVPELIRREKAGEGIKGEPDLFVRITEAVEGSGDDDKIVHVRSKASGPQPLPPLPPLPSPLLCPRRAFIASLILAHKFMQDTCYSNRAWAQVSGLPLREIGRCERALGDALGWRLWVGRAPTTIPTLSYSMPLPVVECSSHLAQMEMGTPTDC